MSKTVRPTIASQEQLSNAVSRFGAFHALERLGHFEMDVLPSANDPFMVKLDIEGDPIDAHVVAIIGNGALLEFSQKTDSIDSEVRAMYFAVQQLYSSDSPMGIWEISPDAHFGDGGINDYNKAALAVARYVYG